jgi:hypothetical protein
VSRNIRRLRAREPLIVDFFGGTVFLVRIAILRGNKVG